ncbi:MAG: immunoglobulin domain-containing protein [Opitutaceae bacterium]|nr:immunoglobulin domain-containing protein [Opitutaceae bacterium]
MRKSLLSSLARGLGLAALCAAAVHAQTDYSPAYLVTTLAGSSSIGSTDGPGAAARFTNPAGIAVDAAGNLYVADNGNFVVRKITPAGVVSTFAGAAGFSGTADGAGAAARFDGLVGIAVDAAGNLYVADTGNHTVRKVTPEGVVTTLAGSPREPGSADGTGAAARFFLPTGVAVDGAGMVFVADRGNHLIRKIAPDGSVSTVAGFVGESGDADDSVADARFAPPWGIAVDASDNLYVTDQEHRIVRKITPGGQVTRIAGVSSAGGDPVESADGPALDAQLGAPWGAAVDAAGNVYFADSHFNTIRKITPDGNVVTVAGLPSQIGDEDGSGGAARFNYPTAVAADAAGNVYVADNQNNTIRKVTPAGTVTTVAGLSVFASADSTDGTGAAARFYQPDGVVANAAGDLFVADTGNHTLRKVTAAGVVTTLAGSPGVPGYADGTGAAARFNRPADVALDSAGNLYVADTYSLVIRKVTPAGVVTTLAGQPGVQGTADGSGGSAQFTFPVGIATDGAGNVFVADGNRLRKVTPAGVVTTLPDASQPYTTYRDVAVDAAGNVYASDPAYVEIVKISPAGDITRAYAEHRFTPYRLALDGSGTLWTTDFEGFRIGRLQADGKIATVAGLTLARGNTDGLGEVARFYGTAGIAVDAAGNFYAASGSIYTNTLRKGQLAGPPTISAHPQNAAVPTGGNVQFSVTAAGVPAPTYQWKFKGAAIAGATGSTLSLSGVQAANEGEYSVTVTNLLGSVTSNPALLTVTINNPTTPVDSGGGGSLEAWFVLALAGLAAVARRRKRA